MSTLCIIMRVSGRLARSWPTSPAEWNVEPLVISARSSTSDVGAARLGEVPGDARAADPGADDHDLRRGPSRVVPRSSRRLDGRAVSGSRCVA